MIFKGHLIGDIKQIEAVVYCDRNYLLGRNVNTAKPSINAFAQDCIPMWIKRQNILEWG